MQVLWVLVAWIVIIATLAAFWVYYLSGKRDPSDEPDVKDMETDPPVPDSTLPESVAPAPDVEPIYDAQEVFEEDSTEEEEGLRRIDVSIHAEYPTIADLSEDMVRHLESLTKALPKLPNVALDLLPVLAQQGSGAAEVANVINRDQATAARMLRWVNSSFYGLEGKVTSLHRAITILGMDTVRSVVLEDSFSRGTFLRGLPGLAPNTIWRHAAAAGIAAKHLAKTIRGVEPDVAATAGLLHDIGLLLILIVERQNLTKALQMSEEQNRPLIDTEFELLGFNHQIWGEAFVLAWRLPPEIGTAIGRHHTPLREPVDRLAVTLWLADYLVSNVGFSCPSSQAPYASDEELTEILHIAGLKPPLEAHITQGLVREMINVTRFWSAGTPDEQEQLAARTRR